MGEFIPTTTTTDVGKAPDLSHHINAHSKARHPSPLKDIIKYMGYEGMISMAGGLPHPSLFPFQDLSISSYPATASLDAANPNKVQSTLDKITIAKDPSPENLTNLATALQYGGGSGTPDLLKWSHAFTTQVFRPARSDFQTLMNLGNTDGWNKVVRVFCERDEYILCEEYTYPSAQSLWVPMGCRGVPIKMDGRGMRADALEEVLGSWDEGVMGGKRPHLMYIVPVGSNPTGSTMDGERRREIYEVCVKYDVIICEDDPYCFLQYGEYKFTPTGTLTEALSGEQFISSLAPSFLKYDYQGRVVRLDTFSKTLAPGNRLGYFVANPIFTERLLRATEVETQAPSGWSQAIVYELLAKWGIDGFITWLSNLRDQYKIRRDWMCNALATSFSVSPVVVGGENGGGLKGAEGLIASLKGKPIFSFVPPTGGMFIWARFYLSDTPIFRELSAKVGGVVDVEKETADKLWVEMVKEKVLLTPGSYYIPWEGSEKTGSKASGHEAGICHFRLAFSMTTKEEMELGIQRMAVAVERFWGL